MYFIIIPDVPVSSFPLFFADCTLAIVWRYLTKKKVLQFVKRDAIRKSNIVYQKVPVGSRNYMLQFDEKKILEALL